MEANQNNFDGKPGVTENNYDVKSGNTKTTFETMSGELWPATASETAETSKNLPENDTANKLQEPPIASTSASNKQPDNSSDPRAGLPPGTSLASIFRYHLGIENDHILVPAHLAQRKAIDPIAMGEHKGRRAVNLGIYNRAIREEHSCAVQYRLWSIVTNGALGLQIIFAAVLTAISASHGPALVVTIFGTLNTIIAGFLTYLKGTGLPMRMKYFHNQWLKLRAYIEQRERDFASDDLSGTHRYGYVELMEEIEVIESLYHNIRKDIERHTPDNFGGSKGSTEESGAPGEGASEASLASKGLNAFRAKLSGASLEVSKAKDDIESHVQSAVANVERQLTTRVTSHLNKLDERTQGNGHYGATSTQEHDPGVSNGSTSTAVESGSQDVSDVAVARMRKTQERALAAQRQAESKVKELEQKLASLSGSTAGSSSTAGSGSTAATT